MKSRLTVLASGTGTNLGAILTSIADGRLNAEVVAVFTNKEDAGALSIARQAGVPTHFLPLSPYLAENPQSLQSSGCDIDVNNGSVPASGFDTQRTDRHRYDADLAEAVAATAPDLVVLAGWMHLLSQIFLDRFPNRVINLHPALPGQFPGATAIADAWAAFQAGRISTTGVMVHYVPDEGVDNGPVIASAEVPIRQSDTFESLCRRIHETEHDLIVTAIAKVLVSGFAS